MRTRSRSHFVRTLAAMLVAASVLSFGPDAPAQTTSSQPADSKPESATRPRSAPTSQPKDIAPEVPRLRDAVSAYLRQHASNPVHWYPWSDEALETARALDRPLFISIGYASCHWCHVMRRESFEDAEVAAFLNAHFVPVKIDREEMPDIDALYMDAVRALGVRGGWPLTVFALPDGTPFFGGTYFPPRATVGRTGLLDLLRVVESSWSEEDQRERILGQARGLRERMPSAAPPSVNEERSPAAHFRNFAEGALTWTDDTNGGRRGAPKFPRPRLLLALTRAVRAIPASRESAVDVDAVRRTVLGELRSWETGGLRDPIGGGFHRYTVDAAWRVPHFEKMLYSQALNATALLEAGTTFDDSACLALARETIDAMLRDFGRTDGAFGASWDADSEEREGLYYVWTRDQVREVLGDRKSLPWIFDAFGVEANGSFVVESAHGAATKPLRASVPRRAYGDPELASRHGVEWEAMEREIERARVELFAARSKRTPPFYDEKVVLGWNALAISTLAKASIVFDEPQYLDAARRGIGFLSRALVRVNESGQTTAFLRSWGDRSPGHSAQLGDVALLIDAALDLYAADFDPSHVRRAREWFAAVPRLYERDENGLFRDAARATELPFSRPGKITEGALPSGNATLARVAIRLHDLTARIEHLEFAADLVENASLRVRGLEDSAAELALAALALSSVRPQLVSVSAGDDRAARDLARLCRGLAPPFSVVTLRPAGRTGDFAARAVPLLETVPRGDETEVHVCAEFRCLEPAVTLDDIRARLADLRDRERTADSDSGSD